MYIKNIFTFAEYLKKTFKIKIMKKVLLLIAIVAAGFTVNAQEGELNDWRYYWFTCR